MTFFLSVIVLASSALGQSLTWLERTQVRRAVRAFAPAVDDAALTAIYADVARLRDGSIEGSSERALNLIAGRLGANVRALMADARTQRPADPARLDAIVRDVIVAHRLTARRAWTHDERVDGTATVLGVGVAGAFVTSWLNYQLGRPLPSLVFDAWLLTAIVYTVARVPLPSAWLPTLPGVDHVLDFNRSRKALPEFHLALRRQLEREFGGSRLSRHGGSEAILADINLILRTIFTPAQVESACARSLARD